MSVDSATSPSASCRMTWLRGILWRWQVFKSEYLTKRESGVMGIGFLWCLPHCFLIDSSVEYWFANQRIVLIWAVHIEPFVDANSNERVSSSILPSHFHIILPSRFHVILHAGLARSCRIHISKIKGKSSPLGRRSLAGRMRGDWQEL